MSHLLHTLWNFLAGVGWVMGLLWIGLAVFTFTALLLAYTRWGQSRALEKCMVLSLLAHLLFFGYATTVQIVLGPGHGYFPAFNVTLCEDSGEGGNSGVSGSSGDSASSDNHKTNDNNTTGSVAASADMWTPTPADPVSLPSLADIHPPIARAPWEPSREFRSEPESLPVEAISPPQQEETILAMPPLVRVEETSLPTIQPSEPTEKPFQKVAERRDVSDWSNVMTAAPSLTPSLQNNTAAARSTTDDSPLSFIRDARRIAVDVYRYRNALRCTADANRVFRPSTDRYPRTAHRAKSSLHCPTCTSSAPPPIVQASPLRTGGNAETEKAVQAALKWLAKNQSADGHWAAGDLGAGQGGNVLGQDRKDAGRQADTGVTGLALLSFPCRRSHPSTRRLYRHRPDRPEIFTPRSSPQRQSRRQRYDLRTHVLPRHGRMCLERGLRHDERHAIKRSRPACDSIHHIVAGSPRRRLALSTDGPPATPANSAGSSWLSRAQKWPASPFPKKRNRG